MNSLFADELYSSAWQPSRELDMDFHLSHMQYYTPKFFQELNGNW